MKTNVGNMDQKISVPLKPNSRVILWEEVGDDNGLTKKIFEGTVDKHIPQTGAITFKDSDVKRTEFLQLVEESDGVNIWHI